MRVLLTDGGLGARTLRGSALTLVSFGGQQFLRLVSNLILTRLLFPEVFGLMALLQIFLVGIEMFSDLGIKTSIMQNPRGHDPDFLNTAWTVQILRGILLWLVACALALPAAHFYDAEMIAVLLPILGFNAVFLGLQSTKVSTASRDMLLGRLTVMELGSAVISLVVTVLLAWWLESVWALVFGSLFAGMLRLFLSHVYLPGPLNHLRWDGTAFDDLFHFGKYIFASSAGTFLAANADRAILGKYISFAGLGIYNIAFFIAQLPLMLAVQISFKIMIPLYRDRPPSKSVENKVAISKARFGLTAGLLTISFVFAFFGDDIVTVLYDARYADAGPVLVVFALVMMLGILTSSYPTLLLAEGASRDFAILQLSNASLKIALIWIGVAHYGALGVLGALLVSEVMLYPIAVFFARKYGGWDVRHDVTFILVIGLAAAAVLARNQDVLHRLGAIG